MPLKTPYSRQTVSTKPVAWAYAGCITSDTATAYFMQKILIISIKGSQLPASCSVPRPGCAVSLRGLVKLQANAPPVSAPTAQANGATPSNPKLPCTPDSDRASITSGIMHSLRKLTSRARLASTPRYTRNARMAQT